MIQIRVIRRITYAVALYGIPAYLLIADGIIGVKIYRWEAFLIVGSLLFWIFSARRHETRADMWHKLYTENRYTVAPEPPKTIRLYPGKDDEA